MKRLAILLVPTLFLVGCQDIQEPLAPSEPTLHSGGVGTADVIVVLRPESAPGPRAANQSRAAAIAQELGLEARHTYGAALYGFSATVPEGRLGALRANPHVLSVELDRTVSIPPVVMDDEAASDPVDVYLTQVHPWGVTRTGGLEQLSATGAGVHVYVLDTGIDPDHPDLQGSLGEGYTVFASTCRGNPKNCTPPTWHDDRGHGTHVAGTIAARDNGFGIVGIAPEVTLHAVKVLGANGSGTWSGIIAGVDWVADHLPHLPRIANMSLGGVGSRQGVCTASGIQGAADALHTAICNATNKGVVFVVAAGNAGADATGFVPAAYYDAAITVSAVGCANQVDRAIETCAPGTERFMDWSNWGQRGDEAWPSEGSLPVAIAGPGSSIFSTYPDNRYVRMSGTSMAAPHVAGAAARVLQALGASQPADRSALTAVRAALLGSTECTATWHNVSGNPHDERFLNLRSADPIDACVDPADPPPTPPTNLEVVGATSSSISLAWQHPAPADARFEIWQYDYADGAWDHLAYVDGQTTHIAGDLQPATAYAYAVRTVNETEVSAWANTVDATTLPDGDSAAPVAAFSYDCGNSNRCMFTNNSTGHLTGAEWLWDLGNGDTYTTSFVPPATYDQAMAYVVTLRLEDVVGRVATHQEVIECVTRGNRLRCK